ncbi:hypothetical protein PYCC9005_005464 [Savitreella phatthalungensis]
MMEIMDACQDVKIDPSAIGRGPLTTVRQVTVTPSSVTATKSPLVSSSRLRDYDETGKGIHLRTLALIGMSQVQPEDAVAELTSSSPPSSSHSETSRRASDDTLSVSSEMSTDSDSEISTNSDCGCPKYTNMRVRQCIAFGDGELDGHGVLELEVTRAWFARHMPMSAGAVRRVSPSRASLQSLGALDCHFSSFVFEHADSDQPTPVISQRCQDVLRSSTWSDFLEILALRTEEEFERDMTSRMKDFFEMLLRALTRADEFSKTATGEPSLTAASFVPLLWPSERGERSGRRADGGTADLCLIPRIPLMDDIRFLAEHKVTQQEVYKVLPQLATYLAILTQDPWRDARRAHVIIDGRSVRGALPAMVQTDLEATLCIAWRDQENQSSVSGGAGREALQILVGRTYDLSDDDERYAFLVDLVVTLRGDARILTCPLTPSHDDPEYRAAFQVGDDRLEAFDPCNLPRSFTDRFFSDNFDEDGHESYTTSPPDTPDDEVKDPNIKSSDLDSGSDSSRDNTSTSTQRPWSADEGTLRKLPRRSRRSRPKPVTSLDLVKKSIQNRLRLSKGVSDVPRMMQTQNNDDFQRSSRPPKKSTQNRLQLSKGVSDVPRMMQTQNNDGTPRSSRSPTSTARAGATTHGTRLSL